MARVNKSILQSKETWFILKKKKHSKFGEQKLGKSFNVVIVSFPKGKIKVYIKL